jgi:hypothetical protein
MQVGQKVVCINDDFEAWVHEYYDQTPVKGKVYTIRSVSLGRGTLVGSDSAEVKLLLEELHNAPDPHHKGDEELGFRSERFEPLEENEAEESMEAYQTIKAPAGGYWSN